MPLCVTYNEIALARQFDDFTVVFELVVCGLEFRHEPHTHPRVITDIVAMRGIRYFVWFQIFVRTTALLGGGRYLRSIVLKVTQDFSPSLYHRAFPCLVSHQPPQSVFLFFVELSQLQRWGYLKRLLLGEWTRIMMSLRNILLSPRGHYCCCCYCGYYY